MAKQPTLSSIPSVQDVGLQNWIQSMHDVVSNLVSSSQVPNAPTNLTVTPIAGGNVVQFTRSNAISYTLFIGDTGDRSVANQVSIGSSNKYTDQFGLGSTIRFYWVVGLNQAGLPSAVGAPVSGTSLPLGTPAAPLPTVRESYATVFDTTLGRQRPVISSTDTQIAGQPAPTDL